MGRCDPPTSCHCPLDHGPSGNRDGAGPAQGWRFEPPGVCRAFAGRLPCGRRPRRGERARGVAETGAGRCNCQRPRRRALTRQRGAVLPLRRAHAGRSPCALHPCRKRVSSTSSRKPWAIPSMSYPAGRCATVATTTCPQGGRAPVVSRVLSQSEGVISRADEAGFASPRLRLLGRH